MTKALFLVDSYLKESHATVVSVKRGKYVTLNQTRALKAPYSVNKDNHDVRSLLGSRTLLKGRVNLKGLNTQQYIRDWHTSLNFAFLNILKDYCLLGKEDARGKPQEKTLQITQEHIHDLIYIIAEYNTVMVDRIKNSEMKEEEIREVIKRLQEQNKKQF